MGLVGSGCVIKLSNQSGHGGAASVRPAVVFQQRYVKNAESSGDAAHKKEI